MKWLSNALVGAVLTSLNALWWTLLSLIAGRGEDVSEGIRQVMLLAAAGAFAGLVYAWLFKFAADRSPRIRYGPWMGAGIVVMFSVWPLQAFNSGASAIQEIRYVLATPSMVVFSIVAGAFGGYMAGRELGHLDPISLGSARSTRNH